MFLLCTWQCHFWCLDFLSFQYMYWHHTNDASLVFFLFEWHVSSCPMILLLFSTSICVIVTMLSFFSRVVQYVYLCHNNCVSFYAFFMSLPNFSCSNFSTTQASSLVLHRFLPFSFSKLGLKLLKPSRQCLTVHLSTLSYMGVSSM